MILLLASRSCLLYVHVKIIPYFIWSMKYMLFTYSHVIELGNIHYSCYVICPVSRYRMIMDELKDLPRPFVIEVMEKTRGMKNKEEILMIMER